MPDSSTGTEEVVDVNKAPESSPEAPKQDANTEAAAPSTADEGAQPKSMLEAVKGALAPEPAKAEAEATGESPDPKGDAREGEPASEKEEEPPFHKHPRWQEMVRGRKSAEARVKELEPEVETFRSFKANVAAAGLSAEEVDNGFDIMRFMKTDPAKAYALIKPYWESLEGFMGNKLSPELQAKVDAGHIDQETAQELVRLNAEKLHREERDKRTQETQQQQRERSEQQKLNDHVEACATAISTWETQWKASDPDYAKKQKLVNQVYTGMLAERDRQGNPLHVIRTPDDAVELVKSAREEVEKTLTPVMRRTVERRGLVGGGSSASKVAAVPKTLREAINLAASGEYKAA
jgi:hypothetical protein